MKVTAERQGVLIRFFREDYEPTGKIETFSVKTQADPDVIISARRWGMRRVNKPATFWDWLKFKLGVGK